MSLKYCGFCHTDVHLANNDWKLPGFEYPAVVGHEIAGIVTKAGENVKAIILIILIFITIINNKMLNIINDKFMDNHHYYIQSQLK